MKIEFASDEEIQALAQAEAQGGSKKKTAKRSEDVRFWKPSVNNPQKEYQAMIRVLPRDPNGKLAFSVRQDMHYINENGVFLTVKCRKTLGDKEFCPICDANWKMYKTNQEALMKQAMSRKNQTTFIANFLILQDLTRPEFNGQVKLWEHRKFMNEMITAPLLGGVQLEQPEFGQQPVLRKFTPYNPFTGHNLIVHMNVNPQNDIPSYANSFWDKKPSAFAQNEETLNHVFSQIIDLNQFVDDVPSVDDLVAKFQDFNERLSAAGQDPGAQRGFATGYAPASAPVGGFAPAVGGFALPSTPVHPQAASIPTNIPGWNTSGFQQPAVAEGNSANYFAGATPTPGIQFKKADVASPQASPDDGADDLPF